MKDIEINVKLALVIGWLPEQIKVLGLTLSLPDERFMSEVKRRIFDYRDPSDIWPIAERYDIFPHRINGSDEKWMVWAIGRCICANTADKAVALALIHNFCDETKGTT